MQAAKGVPKITVYARGGWRNATAEGTKRGVLCRCGSLNDRVRCSDLEVSLLVYGIAAVLALDEGFQVLDALARASQKILHAAVQLLSRARAHT